MTPFYQDERVTLCRGNNLDALRDMPDGSVDSIVTDPPYGLGDEPDALAMLRDWLDSGHHEVTGKGFMGCPWDAFVPQPALWRECLRVLKPGGHLLSFAGTRTIDLVGLGLRIAGFEIRDTIRYMGDLHYPAWISGSGFPKNHDVAAAIDKHLKVTRLVKGQRKHAPKFNTSAQAGIHNTGYNRRGDERQTYTATAATSPEAQQWDGWGTALKPAWEPIIVARKPLAGTVAATVLEYGTGAINIAGCRIGSERRYNPATHSPNTFGGFEMCNGDGSEVNGRWPANVIHDGSRSMLDEFAAFGESASGQPTGQYGTYESTGNNSIYGKSLSSKTPNVAPYGDSGTAARFFYCSKASKSDRSEGLDGLPLRPAGAMTGRIDGSMGNTRPRQNNHPTVKPTALMRYLVRLVTPPGGLVLDPFMGSGSTGKAAMLEGFRFIGIDLDMDGTYLPIAAGRIIHAQRVLAKMPAGMKRRKVEAAPAGQLTLLFDAPPEDDDPQDYTPSSPAIIDSDVAAEMIDAGIIDDAVYVLRLKWRTTSVQHMIVDVAVPTLGGTTKRIPREVLTAFRPPATMAI